MLYSALIGRPTSHSLSPTLYTALMSAAGVEAEYTHLKIDVEAQRLEAAVRALQELKFCGVNVTLPYKVAVMPYLDELDETARVLGAVNTITAGSKLKGYNTDWEGIVRPIRRAVGLRQLEVAAILGSGGAARAAVYAARQLGIEKIQVVHRGPRPDDMTGVDWYGYEDVVDVIARAELVVNATSAGMVGKDPAPFEPARLDGVAVADKVYFEVVFNPLETVLVRYFRERDATVIDGLWMLMYQGMAALSLWLDQEIQVERAELERIHEHLSKEL